jgi:hypothetical protein
MNALYYYYQKVGLTMRSPRGKRKRTSATEQQKLAAKAKKRWALQEADEDAGRRPPAIPDDPPRTKVERDYLSALRSTFSRMDGSPPRAVNKSTALLLSHKRPRKKR